MTVYGVSNPLPQPKYPPPTKNVVVFRPVVRKGPDLSSPQAATASIRFTLFLKKKKKSIAKKQESLLQVHLNLSKTKNKNKIGHAGKGGGLTVTRVGGGDVSRVGGPFPDRVPRGEREAVELRGLALAEGPRRHVARNLQRRHAQLLVTHGVKVDPVPEQRPVGEHRRFPRQGDHGGRGRGEARDRWC